MKILEKTAGVGVSNSQTVQNTETAIEKCYTVQNCFSTVAEQLFFTTPSSS